MTPGQCRIGRMDTFQVLNFGEDGEREGVEEKGNGKKGMEEER